MNRKLAAFIFVIPLTMLAILAFLTNPQHLGISAQLFKVHNLDTGFNYEAIQEAIDANETLNGHAIFVDEGVYHENVVVKKSVSIIGAHKETTIIECNGGTGFRLKANDSRIESFTVRNGSDGVIMYPWTHGSIIADNVLVNNSYGISGHYDCVNMSIYDNTIVSNTFAGIVMLFSNSTIRNNVIADNGKGEYRPFSAGIQIVLGTNSEIVYSINNTVVGNTIENNYVGISALYYSGMNLFSYNNFVNNTKQFLTYSPWNNTVTENYWSDYKGSDASNDGLGDTPHTFDAGFQDDEPLMGVFHSFNTSVGVYVHVISNSTIENFTYYALNQTIKMHVSNTTTNQTFGFCRMYIPYTLINGTIHVTVNGTEPYTWNYTLFDDGENRWIHFSYLHSTLEIMIEIPEYSALLTISLLITATSIALIIYKKRERNQTWNHYKRELKI